MPFPLLLLAGLIFMSRRAARRGKPWPPGIIALVVVLALALPALWGLAFDVVTPLAIIALVVWGASSGHLRKAERRAKRAHREARRSEVVEGTAPEPAAPEDAQNLPPDVAAKVRELRGRIHEAQAYLRERGLSDGELGLRLRAIEGDYLPTALRAYARLPRSSAETEPLLDGKTGREVLLGQLRVLSGGVDALLADAAGLEGQALLAHGRFLETKFE